MIRKQNSIEIDVAREDESVDLTWRIRGTSGYWLQWRVALFFSFSFLITGRRLEQIARGLNAFPSWFACFSR